MVPRILLEISFGKSLFDSEISHVSLKKCHKPTSEILISRVNRPIAQTFWSQTIKCIIRYRNTLAWLEFLRWTSPWDINQNWMPKKHLLHTAARFGAEDIIEDLVFLGADVNIRKKNKKALDNLTKSASPHVVDLLIHGDENCEQFAQWRKDNPFSRNKKH